MYSNKTCSENFAFTPRSISCFDYRRQDLPGGPVLEDVMNMTNTANVPFSNQGYLQAKANCQANYNPWRKTLDFAEALPRWPLKFGRMYPTLDYTNEYYPVQPTPQMDINAYVDVTSNWPAPMIPLRPVALDHGMVAEQQPRKRRKPVQPAAAPLLSNTSSEPGSCHGVLIVVLLVSVSILLLVTFVVGIS